MEKFVIEGGYPLKGRIVLAGAKNSGFKLLIASLFSDSPSEIIGYSRIGDIEITQKIIESLGGKIERTDHQLKVFPKTLSSYLVPTELGNISRACSLFIPPLLFRFGRAIVPLPGGDRIGLRPIDRHLEGLETLGAKIKEKKGFYEVVAPRGLKGNRFKFAKNTHTGTDTLLMAAIFAEGKTILENAAEEPEIDDLIAFLKKMGAKIKRMSERKIEIIGITNFKGAHHEVMPDRNEAVTFGIAALATGGDIFVEKANPKVLQAFLEKVKEIGGNYQVDKGGIRFWRNDGLKATKVKTAPYPGFMTDWQALWTVLMTQAEGESIVHETIFENRFGYVSDLVKIGAKIKLFNPQVKNPEGFYNFNWPDNKPGFFHLARIFGPTPLRGGHFTISDIRAGATLILAALVAKGKTELLEVEHVDRGYEDFDGRLRKLGAKVKRMG